MWKALLAILTLITAGCSSGPGYYQSEGGTRRVLIKNWTSGELLVSYGGTNVVLSYGDIASITQAANPTNHIVDPLMIDVVFKGFQTNKTDHITVPAELTHPILYGKTLHFPYDHNGNRIN